MHYKQFPDMDVSASMAVRKDAAGQALKAKLDAAFAAIDQKAVFADYFKYVDRPSGGLLE